MLRSAPSVYRAVRSTRRRHRYGGDPGGDAVLDVEVVVGDGDGDGLLFFFVGTGVSVVVCGGLGGTVVTVGGWLFVGFAVVGDVDGPVVADPTNAGGGKFKTGWLASAPVMNACQIRAGSDPPVTSDTPAIPRNGLTGSLNNVTAAASCGV